MLTYLFRENINIHCYQMYRPTLFICKYINRAQGASYVHMYLYMPSCNCPQLLLHTLSSLTLFYLCCKWETTQMALMLTRPCKCSRGGWFACIVSISSDVVSVRQNLLIFVRKRFIHFCVSRSRWDSINISQNDIMTGKNQIATVNRKTFLHAKPRIQGDEIFTAVIH